MESAPQTPEGKTSLSSDEGKKLSGLPKLIFLLEQRKFKEAIAVLKQDKNIVQQRENDEEDGRTALSVACYMNADDVVKKLVEYKADVRELQLVTLHAVPLMTNLRYPSPSLTNVRALQVNSTSGRLLNSPLHMACYNPNVDFSTSDSVKDDRYFKHEESERIVAKLIAARADVNAENRFKSRPLHAACIEGLSRCAEQLIKAGADIHARTGEASKSSTPIHLAAEYAHPRMVQLLLEKGADPMLVNKDNETALMVARNSTSAVSDENQRRVIQLLQNPGDSAAVKTADVMPEHASKDAASAAGNVSESASSRRSHSGTSDQGSTDVGGQGSADDDGNQQQQSGCGKCVIS